MCRGSHLVQILSRQAYVRIGAPAGAVLTIDNASTSASLEEAGATLGQRTDKHHAQDDEFSDRPDASQFRVQSIEPRSGFPLWRTMCGTNIHISDFLRIAR